jgi:hypothetical protein
MTSATQIRKPEPGEIVSTTSHVAATPPDPIAWRRWPLVDDWRSIWQLVLAAVVLLAAMGVATQNISQVLIAAAAIIAAAWRIWLPARYEVNSRGLVSSRFGQARRVSWSAVPRVQVFPNGMRLLNHLEPGPFDAWTAIFVPWGEHREKVLAVLRLQQAMIIEDSNDQSQTAGQ